MTLLGGVVAGILADKAVSTTDTARQRAVALRRNTRFSTELDPVATEFNEALGERLQARAEDIENFDLHGLAVNWDVVAEKLDTSEVVFANEEEAVDWLVEEICAIEDVDLDEEAQAELRAVLAEEYADAVTTFRERVAGDEQLERQLRETLELDIHDQLAEMRAAFDQLADRRPYGLYDFPDGRDVVLETLLADDAGTFIDRPEVPATPEPGRHFVLGPSGAGKSRLIAERIRRLPDDAVEHVLLPDQRMLDPSDAKAIARESFDGDLLLVWEDVHRIDEAGENQVLERTLRELDHGLTAQEHTLYTLLEARSGRLDAVPGNLPADFENPKSLWADYEPLTVGMLSTDRLTQLATAMADRFDVALDDDARDALVDRTVESKSAPIYIETALLTASGRLTVADIERLAAEVEPIWQTQYDVLQEDSPTEWQVLAAMGLLYDLDVPLYARLVRAVYLELLEGPRGRFRSAVTALRDRQWLTVDGDEVVATDTQYAVHDTQLDAVRVNALDDAARLSELLLEAADEAVPERNRWAVHFYAGTMFQEHDRDAPALEQLEAALELAPNSPFVHHNYALLMGDVEENVLKAEFHYRRALTLGSENAITHTNLANLLWREQDAPESAVEHFEAALEIGGHDRYAHIGYAELLEAEGDLQAAAEHYEAALAADPDYVAAHVNYANLLWQKLDEPERAAEHYETALELGLDELSTDGKVSAHGGYADLLKDGLDNPERAAQQCRRVLDQDADHVGAHVTLANLLWREFSDPEQAVHHYEAALDVDPDDVTAHFEYANLLANELDAPEAAADHYEAVLEREPEHVGAHQNYGAVLWRDLDDADTARTHLETALDIDPDSEQAHYNYAVLLDNDGAWERAAKHYEAAIELNPDDYAARVRYAHLLRTEQDDPETAADHMAAALELQPEDISLRVRYANLLAQELGDYERAVNHYRRVLKSDWEQAEAHYNLAVVLHHELDAHEEAAEHYLAAAELVPDAAAPYHGYAELCSAHLDEPEQAAEYFGRSRERGYDDRLMDDGRGPDTRVEECYLHGLAAFVDGDVDLAVDLLEMAWSLREDGDGTRTLAVEAGVWLLWLPAGEVSHQSVNAIVSDIEALSPAVAPLWTARVSDEPLPQPDTIADARYDIERHAYERIREGEDIDG